MLITVCEGSRQGCRPYMCPVTTSCFHSAKATLCPLWVVSRYKIGCMSCLLLLSTLLKLGFCFADFAVAMFLAAIIAKLKAI